MSDLRRFSFPWFLEKIFEGVIIAIALFLLSIAGVGILQAYLLPERLKQEGEVMQKKFDEQIKKERDSSIKREADLIESLEQMKKDYATALMEIKRMQPIPPPNLPMLPPATGPIRPPDVDQRPNWNNIQEQSQIDPEKSKYKYIQNQNQK